MRGKRAKRLRRGREERLKDEFTPTWRDAGSKEWGPEHSVQIAANGVGTIDSAQLEAGDVVVLEPLDESVPNGLYTVNASDSDAALSDDLNAPGVGIKELRQVAKPYKIKGAWDMKSDELRTAIRAARAQ